jgi:voltage-gated potassium channel
MKIKKLIYLILNEPDKIKKGYFFQGIIFINILISIIILFLETEPNLKEYINILKIIDGINILIFTIEYILRLYSITYIKKNIFKYALTPLMIIDLLTILPYFLTFIGIELTFLKELRLLRVFKLFKINKFTEFDELIIEIIKEKKEEFIYIFIMLFLLLLTITPLVYYAEKNVQPDVFNSMSTTLWWSMITFTTVGYGDMYPITPVGRILTSMVSFLGIAFYAIPGSIFTASLLEKLQEKKEQKKYIKYNEDRRKGDRRNEK